MAKASAHNRMLKSEGVKPRIMIVEDEFITAEHLQKTLEEHGYEVCAVVPSGIKAIEEAEVLKPDLILMDIILKSELDGIEAAMRIRASNDIPVVFLTAYAHQSMLERAKGAEPYGYILKPFHGKELYTTIEMALHRHQTEIGSRRHVEWLDDTLMSLREAVIIADVDGRIVFMNGAAELQTGWPRHEALCADFSEVVRFEEAAGQDSTLSGKAYKADDFSLSDRRYLRTRKGKLLAVDLSITMIKNEKGQNQGKVAVFRSIEEKSGRERSSLNPKTGYGLLFDTSEDIIFIMDNEQRIVRANKALAEKLGIEPDSVAGQQCFALFHAEGETETNCLQATLLKGGQTLYAKLFHEDTGKEFFVVASPVFSGEGEVLGSVAAARDMAEVVADGTDEEISIELLEVVAQVKLLAGMLPSCASCNKVRVDFTTWAPIEKYIREHWKTDFTHGICPDCFQEFSPSLPKEKKEDSGA